MVNNNKQSLESFCYAYVRTYSAYNTALKECTNVLKKRKLDQPFSDNKKLILKKFVFLNHHYLKQETIIKFILSHMKYMN